MKDHPGGGIGRRRMLASAAAVLLVVTAQVLAAEYAHQDVRISGRELLTFTDAGTAVTVVVGNFQLTMDDRVLSGRDAVVWIDTHTVGNAPQYDLTVYVEGEGKVVEPGGTTTDQTLLVTLRTDGRIRTDHSVVQRDLKDFPLYRRAVQARKVAEAPRAPRRLPARQRCAKPPRGRLRVQPARWPPQQLRPLPARPECPRANRKSNHPRRRQPRPSTSTTTSSAPRSRRSARSGR